MAEFKNELNQVIWDKDELKPEVKDKLKQIANAFIDTMEISKDAVKDIVVTGSLASYNYTEHSDIDLHIIVDLAKVHKDCPIVTDYLLSKKSEFNQKHDIFIYNIPVEVYAEPEGTGTVHNGLYSLNTGWIDYPKKIKPTDNDMAVKAKYEEYKTAAEGIKDGELAEILLDKIKKMRKAGLADGGEFSVENLVFKKLRDNGVIERLMKVKKEDYDKKLSLSNEKLSEALELLEEIATGIAGMMDTQPNPLAGSEQPSKYTKQSKNKQKKAQLGYKYRKQWGKPVSEELLNVLEEIIDEMKDRFYREGSRKLDAISKAQDDIIPYLKKEEDIEYAKDEAAKRKHRANVVYNHYENQVLNRIKAEEESKKKRVDTSKNE